MRLTIKQRHFPDHVATGARRQGLRVPADTPLSDFHLAADDDVGGIPLFTFLHQHGVLRKGLTNEFFLIADHYGTPPCPG